MGDYHGRCQNGRSVWTYGVSRIALDFVCGQSYAQIGLQPKAVQRG